MDRARMEKVVDEFMAAMNARDVDRLGRCCTADVVADEVAEPETFDGLEAFKRSYGDVFGGYPDCQAEMLRRYVDGDDVVCQVRWKATNSGLFRGAEPTGRPVDIRIAYFFHFRGEKIDRIIEYYDLATILLQQGQLEL